MFDQRSTKGTGSEGRGIGTVSASPKRKRAEPEWFPYYAGFSVDFAQECLEAVCSDSSLPVLDPWAGAGTTGLAATRLGLRSVLVDVNPVLAIVCRARILAATGYDAKHAILSLAECRSSRGLKRVVWERCADIFHDSHTAWDVAIRDLDAERVCQVAAVLAYLHSVARRIAPSNPTWINRSVGTVWGAISNGELAEGLRHVASLMVSDVAPPSGPVEVEVHCHSSEALRPCMDASIGVVLGSPPYCTRIDYAVHVRPELEFLGVRGAAFDQLRRLTIGSPVVPKVGRADRLAPEVKDALQKIRTHGSYAAESYYFKFFLRYFIEIDRCISEIARVLVPGGVVALVVQPSHFKDVLVDLPSLMVATCEQHGLRFTSRRSWPARDMRSVNSAARRYLSRRDLEEHLVVTRKMER